MARVVVLLAVYAVCGLLRPACGVATAQSAGIQKVIELLSNMLVKAKKDKASEEVSYSQFSTWCSNQKSSLAAQIANEASEIDAITAEAGKVGSDARVLGEEIGSLQSDIAKYEADKKASTEQREKDHSAYIEEHKDYSESVDALERAIIVLQRQNYDRTAFLQVSKMPRLPEEARRTIEALIAVSSEKRQEPSEFMSRAAPEANAYEFQSTNIIDVLKQLKSDFIGKQSDCEKEEINSKHAHEMIVQDLSDAISRATDELGSKTALKNGKLQRKAGLEKQIASTAAIKADDEQTLSDTKAECGEKSESFKEKQQLRVEEIQALDKAIEILSSDAVAANGAKYLGLAQGRTASAATKALVQTGSDGAEASKGEGIRRHVRDFLAAQGRRLHSKRLGLLAEKLASDPFAKVKKLIDDLITRLLEEANSDADHEGFCDTEIGKSKITRSKLSEEIDMLSAEVDEGKALIAQLVEDISKLSAEVAELQKAMGEATEMRKTEKEQNAATVRDAVDAQKAVQSAVAVLTEFYKSAQGATALLQASATPSVKMGSEEWNSLANPAFEGTVDRGHKLGMQTFGDVYEGQQAEAGGVLAMLEVIASDFAALQSDTEAAEQLSQKSYDSFMVESRKSNAAKSRKIEMNTADKHAAESKLREDTADMKFSQDKLLAADRYYENLKPQCIDPGMTFEERTRARKEEIESLKTALKILEGQDAPAS